MSKESTTTPKKIGLHKEAKTKMTSSSTSLNRSRQSGGTDSMEYSGIVLPTLEDGAGPVALGDLWSEDTLF